MGNQWTGAAGGAASGAATGSAFGPIGTVAGGVLGAVSGWFGGKKKKKKKLSSLDKDQQKLNKAQHEGIFGKGALADLYNYDPAKANEVFDKNVGRMAYRDLNEKTIPSVTGEFRSNGLMQSSYAGDAIAKLARDVQESLDATRAKTLYEEQKHIQDSKRNAVENLQNRQTFAYEKQGQQKSNSNSWQNLLSPESMDSFANSDIGNSVFKMLPGGV